MGSDWNIVRLEDITSKIGSGATPRGGSNSYKEEGISLIRSQNVLDFDFNPNGLAFIDQHQAALLNNVQVEKGDLLLNITGDSVARCCIVDEKFLPARVNQHVAIIRCKPEKALNQFVFYYLQFLKDELLMQAEIGATRRALTKGMIEDLSILLPGLNIQQSIVEMLSNLDDKIDLLHRQNQTLEAMAETLFRQWFVEEAEDEIPLAEFLHINPRLSLAKGKAAPYLEMKNVRTDSASPDGWYLREFTSGTKFQNGDTLLARITPCLENGKTTYVQFLKAEETGWGSTEFLVLRAKEPFPKFSTYLLARNDDFRSFAIHTMTGSSGRQRVQTDSLYSYNIGVPSQDKLEELGEIFEAVEIKIKANSAQITTLTSLRDTLLPKLMSGEVRVEANS